MDGKGWMATQALDDVLILLAIPPWSFPVPWLGRHLDDFRSLVCLQVDSLRYDLEGYEAAVAAKGESEAVASAANRARQQAEERLRM